MATLAELIIDEVRAGRTVTFSSQPAFPTMVHVSLTDADDQTVGRGDCVTDPSDLRQLVHQSIADLGGA